MPRYAITYKLEGQIILEAPTPEEAHVQFYNLDRIDDQDLVEGIYQNGETFEEDAIQVVDILEIEEAENE